MQTSRSSCGLWRSDACSCLHRALCSEAGEFYSLVQRMLAADQGMDLQGFAALLTDVMANEVTQLHVSSDENEVPWHVFCISRAADVLEDVLRVVASGSPGPDHLEWVQASRTLLDRCQVFL